MRNWKLMLVLVVLLAVGLIFIGCGQNQEVQEDDVKEEAVLVYDLGAEPEILDPAPSTGVPEATVQTAIFEGLTRLDKDNLPSEGMAKSWDVSPDGLVYTFHLREDATWTNGDPVTAEDFVYSWKRLLSPEMAAEYAYQLWYVKNGEAYTNGEANADDVGIKALDEFTLEVTLEAPTPYFVSLASFPSLYPVNQKVVESDPDGWHLNMETLVGNGPFKIVSWEHNSKIEIVKNPDYWDADTVKLDKVVITLVESQDTELSMFEAGQIDIAEDPPITDARRLLDEGTATLYPELGIYYYLINTAKEPFDDVRVRKALALGIDRQSIIDNVTQRFEAPGTAVVPIGLPDAKPGDDFREIGGDYLKDNDVETAQQLLAEAGFPGGEGFPEFTILYNTHDNHQKIAEAIQEMWNKNLNINAKLTNQEWGVYLNTRKVGDYEVARAGWLADYVDAMTFLDMWMTGSGNNHTNWNDTEFDRLINVAKSDDNPDVRIKAMHDAEDILMDAMPIIPIYFYTNVNMYKPWVKDVYVPVVASYQEFKWAYIDQDLKNSQ